MEVRGRNSWLLVFAKDMYVLRQATRTRDLSRLKEEPNKVHLGYEVVSAIVYSYECTFARSSVIFHRKGSDDDRTTPAE